MASSDAEELDEILGKMMKSMDLGRPSGTGNRCCKTPNPMQGVLKVRSFKELVQAVNLCRVALILVATTYCPYCYMFKPVFARVAKLHGDKAVFIEVNADYMPEIATSFNVYSTPTTIVLIDGRPADAIVGYVPFNSFNNYVNELLNRIGCMSA